MPHDLGFTAIQYSIKPQSHNCTYSEIWVLYYTVYEMCRFICYSRIDNYGFRVKWVIALDAHIYHVNECFDHMLMKRRRAGLEKLALIISYLLVLHIKGRYDNVKLDEINAN